MLKNKLKKVLTVAVTSGLLLTSAHSFATNNAIDQQNTALGKAAYLNSISNEQLETNKAKQSSEGNFNFYIFLSSYGYNGIVNGKNKFISGAAHFAQDLQKANPNAFEIVKNSHGYVTQLLDIPRDSSGQHIMFLGFSSNLVAKVTFNNQNYNSIQNVKLLQDNPNQQGWFGGIKSMAYNEQTGQLFVGLGSKNILRTSPFDYSNLFFLDFDFENVSDGTGGAIYEYNGANWQIVLHPSKNRQSVTVMRAFTYTSPLSGKKYSKLFSFSTNQQPLQAVHRGFYIDFAGNIPYTMPTVSGGDVRNILMPKDGLNLAFIDPSNNKWGHTNLSQNWGDMPKHYAIGKYQDAMIFAAFKDHSIKAFNLNATGSEPYWNDLIHNSAWAKLTAMIYTPYGKGGSVIAGLHNGTIQRLDLSGWKPGQKAKWTTLKHVGWNSSIDFLAKSPASNGEPGGRYIIAFLDNAAVEYYDMKTGKWSEIHHVDIDGSLRPTAISNVIYDGHDYIVYEGYNNGIIIQIKFDPNEHSFAFKDIKPIPTPWLSSNDNEYAISGLRNTFSFGGQIYPYATKIQADKDFVIAYTAKLSGKSAPQDCSTLPGEGSPTCKSTYTYDGGMGIEVHKVGVKNDWNHIAPELAGYL